MRDLIRQVVVALSAVIAIVGSFIGSGAAGGTPIQDAAGGALSATATPVAPAGTAFAIWSVIYLGLVAYAVWQLLPRQRAAERHRRLGYWIAASLLLNAAWILCVQFGPLPLTLPIIGVLLAVLGWSFGLALKLRPTGRIDALVTDGTIGLYLGWVSIATAANVAAVLTAAGFDGLGLGSDTWAVGVLVIAALVGIMTAMVGLGRIAPALGLAWGLAWVAVGRLTGELHSTPAGVTAAIAAVLVLGSAIGLRLAIARRASRIAFGRNGAA